MLLLLLFLVFSFLFISVLCFVLLLLSLFITFLLTCFFISYHVQYVKFCLSTSLLSSSTSPLFIYPRFLLTSVLPYFLSSLLLPHNYLFPVTITMPNFFSASIFISSLFIFITSILFHFSSYKNPPFPFISLLQFTLNIPTGVKHDCGATCLRQFLETQLYCTLMTYHIQYKIHEL